MAFTLSSSNISLTGTTLKASCKNESGGKADSSLDLNSYIGNENGAFDLFSTGFSSSSRNTRLDGHKLYSELKKSDGTYVSAYLELNAFIANWDGALKFEKP